MVKMILETAQLLSTAHHILDGADAPSGLYKMTHKNHPSAVWAREANSNYEWLYMHYLALLDEYTFRYGKHHKSGELQDILVNLPKNIPVNSFTQPPPAMDVSYIISNDSVVNYRNYYRYGKSHLHKYTKRGIPSFLKDEHYADIPI